MKLFLILILSFLIFEGCGKKSDPLYQGKIANKIEIIS
tara:strand:+ start:162 stop:275 length:114 start_codon:yes stop_codon:yes gene_type:complete